ncbi:hypothetical protein FRC10_000426, partial [Ceratobasidium sp. 414]
SRPPPRRRTPPLPVPNTDAGSAPLFYADASMCLMLGRPMGVRVGDCDVLPLSSVKLEEDVEGEVGEWTHDERPTRWTFIAVRHPLAHITTRVIEQFQDLAGGRHYDTVIELDRALVALSDSLPALYKPGGGGMSRGWLGRGRADRSQDREATNGTEEAAEETSQSPKNGQPTDLGEKPGVYPFLALHRFMINTERQYGRIALHRPYFLRNGEKYGPSRAACFDAARIDRRCRDVFRREVVWPDNCARRDHIGGLYRLFNSTMILGIALLLNPAGPKAAEPTRLSSPSLFNCTPTKPRMT